MKEKWLAAKRNGMKAVVIQKLNEKDLDEVPHEIKKEMKIIPVEHGAEVIAHALCEKPRPLTPEEIEEEEKRLVEMRKKGMINPPENNEGDMAPV